jgi:osmotically-inducible protein OsmY
MKKLLITLLAVILILASSAVFAQNKSTKAGKGKPAAVDCSGSTDAQITENVKAKLAGTASLKDQTIDVATSGGVVTLTGSVKGNHKGLASLQARRVPCVTRVDNQITSEGAAPKKPAKSKNSNKSM